jgi:hypothetical protein
MYRIYAVCLGWVFAGCFSPVWPYDGSKTLEGNSRNKRLQIEGALDTGARIRVELEMGVGHTVEHQQGDRQKIEPILSVDEHFSPFLVITKVLIEVNGCTVRIPKHAFDELASIRRGRVWGERGFLFFRFEGGRGMAKFEAILQVPQDMKTRDPLAVTARYLRTGSSPVGIWERTIYRFDSFGTEWEPCRH